ncbi:hypothetical protein GCM10027073_17330 [Streptomyces chlorus]
MIAQPYAPAYLSRWILSRRAPEYTATVSTREKPLCSTGTVHSLFPHALPGRTAWEQTGQRGSATGQRACPRSFGD